MPLDRMDPSGKNSQQGCLVTGACAHLQYIFIALQFHELSHQSDNIRLRDRLALPDGQWTICISDVCVFLRDEPMAWNVAQHLQQAPVMEATRDDRFTAHIFG